MKTTQTPDQRPQVCEHYYERTRKFFADACCSKGENKNRRCGWLFCKSDCPDFTPKTEK